MAILKVNVPGLEGPCPDTPKRVPGSVRRTSHVDVVRAGAGDEETVITGVARDIRTVADGEPAITEHRLRLVAVGAGSSVVELSSDPPAPGLQQLVGAGVMAGFRRAAVHALPNDETLSLLRRLLDDLPLAFMVSGHAMMLGAAEASSTPPVERSVLHLKADICAGWQVGGALLGFIDDTGGVPHSLGPLAPPLVVGSDPLAWHDRPLMSPRTTRRTRRLDVIPGGSGGPVRLDAHFRDSYADLDGVERSLHEYTVEAEVDGASGVILSASALPRALPWTECPQAAGSVGRVVGLKVDDLSELVRKEFTGISTCTHLNDTLRSLADSSALLALACDV